MKVLFRGSRHLFQYRVTCNHCGSIILFDLNEIEHTYDQRECDEWWSWKCPVCGSHHQINSQWELDSLKYTENEA